MRSRLEHIYLYVPDLEKSYDFYNKFLGYLDYEELVEAEWGFAFLNNGTSIWFQETPEKHRDKKYHRRQTGLNHLAFCVNSKEDVDRFTEEFLQREGIETLYNTPKSFPEYHESYYAVYFEDPNRIKLELAFYT